MDNKNNGLKKLDKTKENNNINNQKKNKNKNIKERKFVTILNIIINSIISIFIIILTFFVMNNYDQKYKITFYLTLWSFFMNEFYFINVSILDLIFVFKNPAFCKYCTCYNDFIRNYFLRICFPFSISIVFLYWMLILLGDDFQYASRDLWDNCVSFTFHGLIFVFLLYDTFSYPHINKKNRKLKDFLIINIILIVYFVVLGVAKYYVMYNPYDFMEMSNIRQVAAAGILIYMGIMDGYIVFVLIANRFFIQEDEIKNECEKNKNDEKIPLKSIISENGQKEENGENEENKIVNKENGNKKNKILEIELFPKNSNRKKLKPINLKNKKKNIEEEY